jgi:hypothetical protein
MRKLVGVILIALFFIIGCEKDKPNTEINNVILTEEELETRSGLRLPIFFNASLTTDNYLLSNQPNYINSQIIF